jgi:glycosyltransferase involved in cell wall biosynthesis
MPKISVIIPAYNTSPFIGEALGSVFAQTYTDFEVIVINDGSPDTDELEKALGPFLERIVYLKQENRGSAGARNAGILHARGEYLAFLDSDDSWLPNFLASQMELLEEIPSLDVVYCDAQHFGNRVLDGKTFMQTCPSNGPVSLENLIREKCQVLSSCTVARRQVIVDAGLFDEKLRRCEDYDLWLRVVHRGGRIAYHRKVLGRCRFRPTSLSRDTVKVSGALLAIYKKAETTMRLPEETRAILHKQMAQAQAHCDLQAGRNFLAARDFERAKDSLTKANHFFRRAKLRVAILGLQLAPEWTRLAAITWQQALSDRR